MPSTTVRYGLLRSAAAGGGDELVGVLTLGVPMSNQVLLRPFPTTPWS